MVRVVFEYEFSKYFLTFVFYNYVVQCIKPYNVSFSVGFFMVTAAVITLIRKIAVRDKLM